MPDRARRLACMAAALACAPASANALREDARVLTADSGRLLYRETHWTTPGPTPERWVLYRCADGKPFARKRVVAATSPAVPDFTLEDARDGYREGVRGIAGSRSVFVRAPGKAESSRELSIPADGVIDAGFDAAVRRHWRTLAGGDAVRLQFLVPSRKRFFPVRVQRMASTTWNGIPAERLRMKLDAWFGFAVPEVNLVYARDDRRLLEFAGTGNLRDARGGYPQVRIVFDQAPKPATAQDIADIRALPLTGRCPF
ncbi:MAG TPA: hypothetical protein VN205_02715 [Thermomonas sp.]|nr:hypothetical protein [Thermomonas sp.]